MKSIHSILVVVLLVLFSAGCASGGLISDPLSLDLPDEFFDSPLPSEDDPAEDDSAENDSGETGQLRPVPEVYELAPHNYADTGNNTRSIEPLGFMQPTADIPKLNDVDPDDTDPGDGLVDCSNFSEPGVIDTCKTISCANDGDVDEFISCRESDDLQITCTFVEFYVKVLPACEEREDEMVCLGMQCLDKEIAEDPEKSPHGDKLEELCETQRREKEDLINNSGCWDSGGWVSTPDTNVSTQVTLTQGNGSDLSTSDMPSKTMQN